jgi:hypothetical protein
VLVVVVVAGAVVVVVAGTVVVVVDVLVVVLVGAGGTLTGVFGPGGGFDSEGTGPAVGTTAGLAGFCTVGGLCNGTGTPGLCTRPKPARSDHQMELTRTTSPVWGALIIKPAPM